jgi:hypothetical protein
MLKLKIVKCKIYIKRIQKMEINTISVNMMARVLYHANRSEVKTIKYEKEKFYSNVLAYIEDFMNKNGFDLVNVHGSDRMYIFHLIKR